MKKSLIPTDNLSNIGINLATGNAIEALLQQMDTNVIFYYYINIHTIIRNFIQLMEGNTADKIKFLNKPNNLYKIAKEINGELEIMDHILPEDSNGNIFYYELNYRIISKKYPNARSLDDFGGLKYHINSVIPNIIGILKRNHHRDFKTVILNRTNTYITTHLPIDLVDFAYSNIQLIESFTGEFKKYTKWYTKLHKLGKKDMSIFPFNKYTYTIMGDEWFLKPDRISIREKIYAIAEDRMWTPHTRGAKVKADLRRDKELYKYLQETYPKIFGVFGL